ncbi:response regulator transcription factor [Neobacillus ginsengisoli]|uniref:Two-component system response regulator YesN n=1 Tax=Neobacillus ginsengisoli TaxID=904295 RepID=A0ABT9XTU3_9BACI|nr:response regulator [Neobacillus ginsengisoli]MDQ0198705.1 two-component system response regulator YesN [Neobacillus ginsengisoli]
MIKVLIADDELIVRKGLIATVDWGKFNMKVIADAPNGQKAWELFQEHSPEVVITDIVMPEMNGIEFARKIKQNSPATKIILLSCHRDFTYAQEGMNIGASGYILKTAFQDQQFEEYLGRFEREINLANVQNAYDSSSLAKEFYEWLCDFENSFPKLLEELFSSDWKWMRQPYFIYLLNGVNNSELLQKKLPSEEKHFARISCGKGQAFIFIPEKSHQQFERFLVEARTIDSSIRWKTNGPNQGMTEWMDGVSKLYRQLKFEKQFKFSLENWPLPIQRAVQIIIQHLHESLSSTYIANEVGLSRSHFSTMFKKTVGESFISFTEKIKVQAACDLLENSSLTLQEIGEKVGIQDGKYFSKWFKKCIGKTPSDYRQNKNPNVG